LVAASPASFAGSIASRNTRRFRVPGYPQERNLLLSGPAAASSKNNRAAFPPFKAPGGAAPPLEEGASLMAEQSEAIKRRERGTITRQKAPGPCEPLVNTPCDQFFSPVLSRRE